jgi:hypothetical protein
MSPPAICDFELRSNKYSWVNELTQNLSYDDNYAGAPSQSELYKKRTTAECREKDWLEKDLLGGRTCNHSTQCFNGNCSKDVTRSNDTGTKFCQGRLLNESCSTSADCDSNLFCGRTKNHPYTYECQILKTSYE